MIMFNILSWHWEDAERIQLEMGGRAITQIDPSVTIYSNGTERNEYLLHSHQYFNSKLIKFVQVLIYFSFIERADMFTPFG